MKKLIFIGLGGLTFGLGTLGIFLPFLPTAVFYLLTAFFWLRSSDKLYQKFIQSESYQKYVQETLIKKNISTKSMIRMFLVIGIVFLIPCLLVDNLMMRIVMGIIYAAHVICLTWHLKGKSRKAVTNSSIVKVSEPND